MSTFFPSSSHLQQRKCQFDSGPLQAKRHALRLTVEKELLCCGARAKTKGGKLRNEKRWFSGAKMQYLVMMVGRERKQITRFDHRFKQTKQHCGAPRSAAIAVKLTARASCWPRGASLEKESRAEVTERMKCGRNTQLRQKESVVCAYQTKDDCKTVSKVCQSN